MEQPNNIIEIQNYLPHRTPMLMVDVIHELSDQEVKTVLEIKSGRVEITSQNHGYAVDEKSLPSDMKVTHIHLNDRTVSGVEVIGAKAFSVQYHPESCPGPHDSRILFDRFIASMGN